MCLSPVLCWHYCRLLLGSSLSPEQRELAETIFDSSNALLSTLADILDFSVLDTTGALHLKRKPVCMQQVRYMGTSPF